MLVVWRTFDQWGGEYWLPKTVLKTVLNTVLNTVQNTVQIPCKYQNTMKPTTRGWLWMFLCTKEYKNILIYCENRVKMFYTENWMGYKSIISTLSINQNGRWCTVASICCWDGKQSAGNECKHGIHRKDDGTHLFTYPTATRIAQWARRQLGSRWHTAQHGAHR